MVSSTNEVKRRRTWGSGILAAGQYASANILLLLGAVSLLVGGWMPFVVILLIMVFGSFADELSGEDLDRLGDGARTFYNANLYLALPLMCLLAVLLAVYARNTAVADHTLQTVGAVWVVGYLFALVGATVGHELTHRQGWIPQAAAHVLLGFTFNTSFVIYHVHVHHRRVGSYDEASTARRGERLFPFLVRAVYGQYAQAASVEAERLRRKGLPVWSRHNKFIQALAAPLAIVAVVTLIGGAYALLLFVLAALLGRFFHELINYVQHYGIVRAENAPIRPRHSWDCYHRLSNVLHYNLPRHSDHHMFATKPFWRLDTSENVPMLPYGYQTMATFALVFPLWRYIMRPLLADWDRRFASDAELEIMRSRGWEVAERPAGDRPITG
ncbi:alkane 1-monooxygenase [Methyloceanibacter caenitepidi]|uniref:Alkane-1 monooxygenase n=1 Tax=Methyloceanibacter caenitepidi TaxID=1384459 RepID=A0A0A8K451_9HYPH|nr:alkane 1-monooxygenase [Methyloceanibacter caenitepidi]BAQ16769.1 alkane-1 monooxygenase [Methyloceanibacter caenitepidi]